MLWHTKTQNVDITFLVELLESKIGFEDNKQAEIHTAQTFHQSFLQSDSQNMKNSSNHFTFVIIKFLQWIFQASGIKNLSELSIVVICYFGGQL